ncbi:flagellar hook-length control protein FliK [Nitratireductor luteus]|uniref:flagellar hook-length control protein FliK n=1 Tax=Nitratireductor luteus TaxID=2976980 RepID=UPI00223F2E7E|nr:flagellar hook-length control protein FliK [Nitratireductor luteus]
MTDAIRTNVLAVMGRSRDVPRNAESGTTLADLFSKELGDNIPRKESDPPTLPQDAAQPKADLKLSDLFQKLDLPEDAGQDEATEIELPVPPIEAGDTENQQSSMPTAGASAAEVKGNLAPTVGPARGQSDQPKADPAGEEAEQARQPGDHTQASQVTARPGAQAAKSISGPSEIREALVLPQTRSGDAENTQRQGAVAVGDKIAAAAGKSGSAGDMTEDRSDQRQQGGNGENAKAFRVVSVQSAPAPAAVTVSTSPTGTALVGTLNADPGFAAAAAEAARIAASGGERPTGPLHTLKIQLHPAELGAVTAKLSLSGEQLMVEIQVDNADARQRLNADGDSMLRALRAMGYEVDRIQISQNASNGAPAAGNQPSGREPSLRQSTGGDRQSGSGANGEGNSGHGRKAADRHSGEMRNNDPSGGDLYI